MTDRDHITPVRELALSAPLGVDGLNQVQSDSFIHRVAIAAIEARDKEWRALVEGIEGFLAACDSGFFDAGSATILLNQIRTNQQP